MLVGYTCDFNTQKTEEGGSGIRGQLGYTVGLSKTTSQPTNQPTNQQTNQLANQPANQQINKPTS